MPSETVSLVNRGVDAVRSESPEGMPSVTVSLVNCGVDAVHSESPEGSPSETQVTSGGLAGGS